MHRVARVPGGDGGDAYNDDDEGNGDPPPPPRTVSTAPALMPEMIGENQGVAAEERVRLYLPRAVVGGAEMYVSQHSFVRSFVCPPPHPMPSSSLCHWYGYGRLFLAGYFHFLTGDVLLCLLVLIDAVKIAKQERTVTAGLYRAPVSPKRAVIDC